MSKEKHTCCAETRSGDGWHSRKEACGCKASVEREGKWYCKRHDPVAIKEKDEARRKKWKQEWEESKKEQRLKNATPDMLAALKRMVNIGFQHDAGCHPSEGIHTEGCLEKKAALEQARAAINKAEGKE